MKDTSSDLLKTQILVCTCAGLFVCFSPVLLCDRLGGPQSRDSLATWHNGPLLENPAFSIHRQ